ncbi:rod shape-determining protein MreC [Daejeonella oryzae]|uniref:rod shape-determining protein MreC n=1 Tax=Daejeonella oryzae TaxID=1122943 RepID=UPI000423FEA6|nr:rod shape-determining protein MreC [Daejeonella oryzae]
MRNVWIFISKYNAFFLLIIFLVISFILLVNNNSYQRASTLNSSNQLVGTAYERINNFTNYLNLGSTNDSLAAENAKLKAALKESYFNDSIVQGEVKDSVKLQQYTYIVAKIVNKSIHQKNNYITINRGSRHGIKKGMGVISSKGIVGIILNVSPNFSTIQSLLHNDTRISASVNNNIGSLIWGEGNYDSRLAILKDIPNHVSVKKGDLVTTSGYSLFPAGLEIGRITKTGIKGGDSFLDIEIQLSTDFSTLQYVYVVNNLLSGEQNELESQNKTE